MNQQQFEASLLHLWMTSRVPMTRANLLFYTKASRARLDRWLDELVGDGVLDVDSDDEGEMVWAVRGAVRPASGPTRVEEVVKLERFSSQVGLARTALTVGSRASRALVRGGGEGDKSLIASGLLSFFLGPIGWLYAGSLREALPASVVFLLAGSLIARLFFFVPLMPLCAVVGVLYAWRYNQNGQRTPILGDGDPPALPRKRL